MVVYHLFRRTGRFTVWANSEHFKFSPGIAFAICTNQFHSSKKWPRRPETRIKDGFEENGTRISVWNIPFGKKRGLPCSGVPLLSETLHWNDPKSSVPFTFQPYFSESSC